MRASSRNAVEFSGILVDAIRAPVTASLCVAAIVLALIGSSSVGLDPFVEDGRALWAEPWRLASAHFVHSGPFHLIFNVYWTWTLGRLIEARLGSLGLGALVAYVMLGVSLGCIAFDRGGIGLSGIGYGLWGFLLVGERRSPELRGLVDRRTHWMFAAWFFVCIALTMSNVWLISNWGHGLGALLGASAALCVDAELRWRRLVTLTPIGVLLVLALCATSLREHVNFGGGAQSDAYEGYAALGREDWSTAREHYSSAVRIDPEDANAWWNLACAQFRLNDPAAAADSAFRACEVGMAGQERRDWTRDALMHRVAEEIGAERYDRALEQATRAARVAPDDIEVWESVRWASDRAGDTDLLRQAESELDRLRQ